MKLWIAVPFCSVEEAIQHVQAPHFLCGEKDPFRAKVLQATFFSPNSTALSSSQCQKLSAKERNTAIS